MLLVRLVKTHLLLFVPSRRQVIFVNETMVIVAFIHAISSMRADMTVDPLGESLELAALLARPIVDL